MGMTAISYPLRTLLITPILREKCKKHRSVSRKVFQNSLLNSQLKKGLKEEVQLQFFEEIQEVSLNRIALLPKNPL